MATDWRALFSLTSRMRLSRGVWRDEILSLDRANWRRGDRGQEEEVEERMLIQNAAGTGEYIVHCSKYDFPRSSV